MSMAALKWAMKETSTETLSEKLTLIVLAFHHNAKTGRCNPGETTIAQESGMSQRSVSAAKQALARRGLIEIHPDGGDGRGRSSDRFVLLGVDPMKNRPLRRFDEQPANTAESDQGQSANTAEQPATASVEPKENPKKAASAGEDEKSQLSEDESRVWLAHVQLVERQLHYKPDLSAEDVRAIRSALADFSPDQLVKAIEAAPTSEWFSGRKVEGQPPPLRRLYNLIADPKHVRELLAARAAALQVAKSYSSHHYLLDEEPPTEAELLASWRPGMAQ